MSRGGRRAALPTEGWQPPEGLIAGSDGMAVRFIEQSGLKSKVFDFGELPVQPGMQRWLAQAFVNRTGPRAALTRLKTAEHIFAVIRWFADLLAGSTGPVRGPQDLTPAHVTAFRLRYAGLRSGYGYLETLRTALRDERDLPPDVRVALLSGQAPRPALDDPEGTVPYSDGEMQAIMTALRRDVRCARDRIRAGRDLVARYRASPLDLSADEQRAGRLLDLFDRTGDLPRYLKNGEPTNETRKAGGIEHLGARLCLTLNDATAFALLLTAMTGENFGTVAAWPAASYRPDGGLSGSQDKAIALVEQVKPRRGPEREHMVVALEDIPPSLQQTLTDTGDHRLFRSPLRVFSLLVELTEVSRRHGGHDLLFSAFTPYPGRYESSRWIEGIGGHHVTRWAKDRGFPNRVTAGDTGLPAVSVRRLRQTVIEQGRRPVSHTRQTMNDHYLMRSRTVREDSRKVVGAALRDEVGKARATQKVPVFTPEFLVRARHDLPSAAAETGLTPQVLEELIAGVQDTPLASCTDYLAGPRTEPGQPCTASFLDCLGCDNARALPHQLPIQIAAADWITQLRGNLAPELWRIRFEPRLRQLHDIFNAYTPAEQQQARTQINDRHRALIDEVFNGKWDLR